MWDMINEGNNRPYSKVYSNSTKLLFEMLKAEQIVEIIDPKEYINEPINRYIVEQQENDRKQLANIFPDRIKLGDESKVPGQLFIDDTEFCYARVTSLYASLLLSKCTGAQCLFDDNTLTYCKYKFGLQNFPRAAQPGKIESFKKIFDLYMPDIDLFPDYVIGNMFLRQSSKQCKNCANETTCSDSYLSSVEQNVKKILTYRSIDEIQQIISITNTIINRGSSGSEIIDPNDIYNEFEAVRTKAIRQIYSVFPRIKRWSNILTMLSIPVAVLGVATSNPLITVPAASIVGIAQAAKEFVEASTSKSNWVTFIGKQLPFAKISEIEC